MCTSTRFPEAIPLRNILAKKIIEAVIKFFTLVGLPKTLQSDQGSNFISQVFQQVMHELGIQQRNSSAYHPQSQGAIERFHQSMKYSQTPLIRTPQSGRIRHPDGKPWERNYTVHFVIINPDAPASGSGRSKYEPLRPNLHHNPDGTVSLPDYLVPCLRLNKL